MKITLVFLILTFMGFITPAMAATNGLAAVRRPNGFIPSILDTSGTNVTNAAWVQVVASLPSACSALLLHNPGAQPIKIGYGAAASEVESGIVFPIGVSVLVPVEIPKGKRIAVRSMGSTQSSGVLTMSCFQ